MIPFETMSKAYRIKIPAYTKFHEYLYEIKMSVFFDI